MDHVARNPPHKRSDNESTKTPNFRKKDGDIGISKTISWILRHGAQKKGLDMRQDGCVCVRDLLEVQNLRSLDLPALQEIVQKDQKQRYSLLYEPGPGMSENNVDAWWIKANQGHSLKTVQLELQEITSASEIPMAVHGTSRRAWESIATQGLSKMGRNHIHLAQGIARDRNVVSGMRNSSQILIFIDVQKALDSGIKFFLSQNGVVLSEGDERGFIAPEFFARVENMDRTPIKEWEGESVGGSDAAVRQ